MNQIVLKHPVPARWLALLALAFLGGCADDPLLIPPTPQVSSVSISPPSGTLNVGADLQLQATALDVKGRALDVPIQWATSDSNVVSLSNTGLVTGVWLGEAVISASASGHSNSISISVVPGAPSALSKVSGDLQSARSGQSLQSEVVVRITDQGGAPVPSVTVHFEITAGSGGSVAAGSNTTGENGEVSATWTLGLGGGEQRLGASVANSSLETEFEAFVIPSGLIIGSVFLDQDRDGTQGAGEGLAGVEIELWAGDALSAGTTTDGEGRFEFQDVDQGSHRIRVDSGTLSDEVGLGSANPLSVILEFDDTISVAFRAIVPVSEGEHVTAIVDLPGNVDPDKLLIGTVQGGLRGLTEGGALDIHVPRDASTLVAVIDSNTGDPILLAATTDEHASGAVLNVTPLSTALALITLSPVFPTNDPAVVGDLQDFISGLPEVANLALVIQSKVASGQDYWSASDFEGALMAAMDAAVNALVQLGASQATVDPISRIPSDDGNDPDSGVRVRQTTDPFSPSQSLAISNSKPRAVDVYAFPVSAGGRPDYGAVEFGLRGNSVFLPRAGGIPASLLEMARFLYAAISSGDLLAYFGETDARPLNLDFRPGEIDEFLIAAYGLGFHDGDLVGLGQDLFRGPDFGKLFYPTFRTLLLDVLMPPVLNIAGLPQDALRALHLPEYATALLQLSEEMERYIFTFGDFEAALARGEYAELFNTLIRIFAECTECWNYLESAILPILGPAATRLVIEVKLCVAATVATSGTAGVVCGLWFGLKFTKALLAVANSAYVLITASDAELREEFILRRPLTAGSAPDAVLVNLGNRGPGECDLGESCQGALYDVKWPVKVLEGGRWVLRAAPVEPTCVNIDILSNGAGALVAGTYLHRGSEASQWQFDLNPGDYYAGLYVVRPEGCSNREAAVRLSFERPYTPPPNAGRLTGRVIDAAGGQGLEGAAVTFSTSSGAAVGQVSTGSEGHFLSPLMAPGEYDLLFSKSGYVGVPMFGAAVRANETTTLETVPLVPESPYPGGISGRVLNARNGQAVAGARVELRQGMNATEGAAVGTTLTNSAGAYSFSGLGAGTYSIAALAQGFSPGTKTGIVIGNQVVRDQDVVLSPASSGEIRVVLTWGATPPDLDSHLTGPLSTGSRFHVFFSDKGSLSGPPYAALDRDDIDSYGPETITINQVLPGVYRYSVHNYSDWGSTNSRRLADSGAKVEVYQGSDLIRVFFVPNSPGTLWTVFEMTAGEITPINSMVFYQGSTGGIPAPGEEGATLPSDAQTIFEASGRGKRDS